MPAPRIPSNPSSSTTSSVNSNSHYPSFRSPLSHILPRHALFRVKLQIHQLSNVPLLGGQFGVKWRFKHVQSAGRNAGLLAKMRANKSSPHIDVGKGKSRELNADEDATTGDEDYQAVDGTHGHGIYINDFQVSSGSSYFTAGASKLSSSSSTTASSDSSSFYTNSSHTPASSISTEHSYSDGRGVTDWAPLLEHTAKWEHTVSVVVRMDVDRETSILQSNDLKLAIMQKVVPGDRDSPQQPQRGVVHLNLAEYADAGPVTRRYLLRQSKTNATLKLTIELEHIGSEQQYQAPPLQKGEILAQVSGLLSNSGFQRARFLRELETLENPNLNPGDIYGLGRLNGLASSQSIRATELLIETIFNPIPSKIPSTTASPFTREVPLPTDEDSSSDSLLTEQKRTDSSRSGTHAPSMASANSGEYSSSTNGSDKPKSSWWRKVSGNRPRTPIISSTPPG